MRRHLEWLTVAFSVPGALMIALNLSCSKYGFLLFLISNVFALLLFSLEKRRWFLVQTLVYTSINLIGAYRWLMT